MGLENASAYAATKAAILSLAKSLNADLFASNGIRFNSVSPGPTETPLFDKLGVPADQREQVMHDIRRSIPAGRFGNPVEIAKAVVYLASDESGFAIGHDFVIDGGQTVKVTHRKLSYGLDPYGNISCNVEVCR
jgi:NAD(P)-dependent dehydrogenase (short-subunit alcohol dehydrogenase family)